MKFSAVVTKIQTNETDELGYVITIKTAPADANHTVTLKLLSREGWHYGQTVEVAITNPQTTLEAHS
jgi:hypothetical protein